MKRLEIFLIILVVVLAAGDVLAQTMCWPTDSNRMNLKENGFRTATRPKHQGIDIGRRSWTANSPIFAAYPGKVTKAGWGNDYGRVIYINHGNEFETRYAHLEKFYVKAGDWVDKGQKIGIMGNSGRSSGVHLHFEVRINGRPVNPMGYVSPTAVMVASNNNSQSVLAAQVHSAKNVGAEYMLWPSTSRDTLSHHWWEKRQTLKISGNESTPVFAAYQGRVEQIGSDYYKGRFIRINHGHQTLTYYGRLSSINVRKGQMVNKGDQIGTMGHDRDYMRIFLAFQIEMNGQLENPYDWIQ